jgi:hypothetical protein
MSLLIISKHIKQERNYQNKTNNKFLHIYYLYIEYTYYIKIIQNSGYVKLDKGLELRRRRPERSEWMSRG